MLNKKSLKLIKTTLLFIVFFFVAKTPDLYAGSYVVHVSSYQNKEKAIFDKVLLEKNDFSAFIKTVDLGSKGVWFRVLIGPYSDYNQAKNIANTITRKKLVSNAKVIPHCGFKYISKNNGGYTAQCMGGTYDGSVFKIKRRIGKTFYVFPEIALILNDATGVTSDEAGKKACGCK
jgi:SPOR domain